MTKFVIPAIDIQGGKCVRLTQGDLNQKTIYYENPLEALLYWEDQGADRIHIVDLDGAFGIGTNYDLISAMIKATSIKIQMGGGIRTLEKAKTLVDLGIERVVVGTTAVKDPSFVEKLAEQIGKQSVIVALDMKDGKPAIKGWTETVNTDIFEFAKIIEEKNAGYILMSSVSGDGAFKGPDISNTKKMISSINIPVIAAGGVRNKQDILDLQGIGAYGVVVGKAFYEKDHLDYNDVKSL